MPYISSLAANSGECPVWKVPVTVTGFYREKENGDWSFLRAECPIIQNAKLPREDQIQKYELMYCPNPNTCTLYTEFQPCITKHM